MFSQNVQHAKLFYQVIQVKIRFFKLLWASLLILDSPKSMNSNDSALQFNSFPQVPTDQNYASISRNVSRIRPTSFNTMRPISISGVPDKQEFQSYMSQTLPLRGSLRNKKNNSVPAPPVPITKRNRTEVNFYSFGLIFKIFKSITQV